MGQKFISLGFGLLKMYNIIYDIKIIIFKYHKACFIKKKFLFCKLNIKI